MSLVAELEGIHRVYPMGEVLVRALNGVDMQIHAGEYVAIMGPSGSGKSTMLNLLGCLDRPSEGEYRLDGRNVAHLDDDELSRIRNDRLGFVFQSYNLIPHLTVLENIEVPLEYAGTGGAPARERATALAERMGLGDRLDHRPTELSGGQQQRVAIARALANEPSLLLADEPTGNLDSATGEEILGLLDQLNREGTTLVIVTHDPEIGRRAHRTVHMIDGRIDRIEVNR